MEHGGYPWKNPNAPYMVAIYWVYTNIAFLKASLEGLNSYGTTHPQRPSLFWLRNNCMSFGQKGGGFLDAPTTRSQRGYSGCKKI